MRGVLIQEKNHLFVLRRNVLRDDVAVVRVTVLLDQRRRVVNRALLQDALPNRRNRTLDLVFQ